MESEYFGESSSGENLEGKAFLQVYKGVLNSKAREDYLVRSFHFRDFQSFSFFLLSTKLL
jgi:hypothetical protein